jgi:hypothetical protein
MVRDLYIGYALFCQLFTWSLVVVIFAMVINWQMNGIPANISGEVTCAPLPEGLYMSANNNLGVGSDDVKSEVENSQEVGSGDVKSEVEVNRETPEDRASYCSAQFCMGGLKDCVPTIAYTNYDCCIENNC